MAPGALRAPAQPKQKLARISENNAKLVIKSDENKTVLAYASGFSQKELRALRSAKFRPQARIDLHGMTADEAQRALERFVSQQRSLGRRQLLVIHGKGQHSEGNMGVLGNLCFRYFSQGRIAAQVLAASSAHPALGGTGALAIRLRKSHES